MTSLNNRRQLNDNDLRPNSFVKLVQKSLVWNYEPYYAYLRENIYN